MTRGTRARLLRAAVAQCCGWLLLHATSTQAATLQLDLGAEHSDNATRVATDEQSDTIGTAGIALGVEDIRPRLETHIAADLQYRRYFDDTYDNDVVGGFNGDVAWSIIPERFIWVVEDNYGQIVTDRLAADTPDNRDDFNYFSTGPDIILGLGARTSLLLSGRWSDSYFGATDEDSETVEGTAGLARKVSEENTVSLNAHVSEISYDDSALFEEYQISEGHLRWESEGSRTTFSLDAGYTQAERGDDKSSGPLVRLDLKRELTSRTTFGLQAGSEFDDTASAFRIDQNAVGVSPETADLLAAGDVFRNTYVYLTLGTERERTELSAALYGRKERHEEQTELDRDTIGGRVSLARRLSSRLDFDVHATYNSEDFVEGDLTFHEWSAGAGLGFRFTPAVSIRLSVAHVDGSGDGTLRDFEENRAYLGLRYTVGQRGN